MEIIYDSVMDHMQCKRWQKETNKKPTVLCEKFFLTGIFNSMCKNRADIYKVKYLHLYILGAVVGKPHLLQRLVHGGHDPCPLLLQFHLNIPITNFTGPDYKLL